MSNNENVGSAKKGFRENLVKIFVIISVISIFSVIGVSIAYSRDGEEIPEEVAKTTETTEIPSQAQTTTEETTETTTIETTEVTTEQPKAAQPKATKPQVTHDYVASPGAISWDGAVLTRRAGSIQGPSGKETYYNWPMNGVIRNMRSLGYSEAEYPYWIRDDGCKMLGDYIMVAAALNIRPYGTIVETSRGLGIVADTGSFASSNRYQLDLAVSW